MNNSMSSSVAETASPSSGVVVAAGASVAPPTSSSTSSSSVKSRFSATDIKAMVRDLRGLLVGQRVANVYDLDERTYLIKFALPGKAEKDILLIESGVRFHTTSFVRDTLPSPGVFSRKLRAALKGKRLEGIVQLGSDRVVDFKFGSGDAVAHVIIELHSSGNIVLVDAGYEIVATLRTHKFNASAAVGVKEIYPVSAATTLASSSGPSGSEHTNSSSTSGVLAMTPIEFLQWAQRSEEQYSQNQAKNAETAKKSKAKKLLLRHLLFGNDSGLAYLGPEVLDCCLREAGCAGTQKVQEFLSQHRDAATGSFITDASITRLLDELRKGPALLELIESKAHPGTIVADAKTSEYLSFAPFHFTASNEEVVKTFPTFNNAVDEYFRQVEEQRLIRAAKGAEEAAVRKVENTKADQERMIRNLVRQQELLEAAASSVELCSGDIEKVRLVLNSALGSKISWDDIEEMVKSQTAAGNPIASLIVKLDLAHDLVTVRLPNALFSGEAPSDAGKAVRVVVPDAADATSSKKKKKGAKDAHAASAEAEIVSIFSSPFVEATINLTQTAFSNARIMYADREAAKRKQEKAEAASAMVIKKVEAQVMKNLAALKLKTELHSARKIHWFEKFNWFISTEGYLVISGRDAMQSDIIMKKHLRPGDAYVHADVRGAVPWIVRRKPDRGTISLFAIQEAGNAVICWSAAWSTKTVLSAWWVPGEQVSKISEHGDRLPQGVYSILGRKNFLLPATLEMGFGVLFKVDAESAARHVKDRVDKLGDVDDDTVSMLSEAVDRYGLSMEYPASAATAAVMSLPPVPERSESRGNKAASKNAKEAVAKASQKGNQKPNDKKSTEAGRGKEKGAQGGGKNEDSDDDEPPKGQNNGPFVKKKPTNKKKMRKYADQDEEDFELAMRALGLKKGDGKADEEKSKKAKKADLKKRQDIAGISLLKEDWDKILQPLSPEVRVKIDEMIAAEKLKQGDIDSFTIGTLASFGEAGVAILADLNDELGRREIQNVSGFLAGIMRRHGKQQRAPAAAEQPVSAVTASDSIATVTAPAAGGAKTLAESVEAYDDADDSDEEQDQDEDLAALVSSPTAGDNVLYAIPVCGPYSTFKNFKFKLKLTPGTLKKGKIAKQALEAFGSMREATAAEKRALSTLSLPELVAALIGDAKISMPGLQTVQRQTKQKSKSKK